MNGIAPDECEKGDVFIIDESGSKKIPYDFLDLKRIYVYPGHI